MFNFFKKKPEVTYKQNVIAFWEWFEANSKRFTETINKGECQALGQETTDAIYKVIPGIGWCYGPGKSEGRHSLTLSPAGYRNHQFLAEYWLAQAPEIEGWDFYSAKQGGNLRESYQMKIARFTFSPNEIWIAPEIDEENQIIHIEVWHSDFGELEDNGGTRITLLFLDELLGEYGTENWIGAIDIGKEKLADSIPLMELADYIKEIEKAHGWTKSSPSETYHLYNLEPIDESFPRADAYIGSTSHTSLVGEYLNSHGKVEDLLDKERAAFVFVRFDNSILPKGSEIDVRTQIEDSIETALAVEHSGHSFGGAMGSDYAYLDFILFDGKRSVELLLQAMKDARLPGGSTVHYWDKDRKIHKL